MKTIFKFEGKFNVTASDAGEGQVFGNFFAAANGDKVRGGRYLVVWDYLDGTGQGKQYFDDYVEALRFAHARRAVAIDAANDATNEGKPVPATFTITRRADELVAGERVVTVEGEKLIKKIVNDTDNTVLIYLEGDEKPRPAYNHTAIEVVI